MENILTRYPRKAGETAFETMKNEVSKLLLKANFNIRRVQESLQANSEKALPTLKAGLFSRLDKLDKGEKNAVHAFLLNLEQRGLFVATPDQNPTDTDDFKKTFARVHAAERSISEARFLAVVQESGLLNRLLRITKTHYLVEYVPSSTLRGSREEAIKRLEKPSSQKISRLIEQASTIHPESVSILKDLAASEGVIYAPELPVQDILNPIVAKYKGYVALSPLIQQQVKELPEPKAVQEGKKEVQAAEKIDVVVKDMSGNPVAEVLVESGLIGGVTDGQGIASLQMPEGLYSLTARKNGFSAKTTQIQVPSAGRIELQLEPSVKAEDKVTLGFRIDAGEPSSVSADLTRESTDRIEVSLEGFLGVTMVIGASRAGKTTTVKQIVEQLIRLGVRLVVVDFKGEYLELAQNFGFRIFSLKPSQQTELLTLNMLDRGYFFEAGQDHSSIENHSRYVASLVSEYFHLENKPISQQQRSLLCAMVGEELKEANPNLEGLVRRIQDVPEEAARSLAAAVSKAQALKAVFANTTNAYLRYLLGQNVLIDISGKGLYKQPGTSEKLLICYAILKALESANPTTAAGSRPVIVVDEITSQPKDGLFKQESERLILSMEKRFGIVISGRDIWSGLLGITKTIIAHRQANEKMSLDLAKMAPQVKGLADQLLKMPPNMALLISNSYTGLMIIKPHQE